MYAERGPQVKSMVFLGIYAAGMVLSLPFWLSLKKRYINYAKFFEGYGHTETAGTGDVLFMLLMLGCWPVLLAGGMLMALEKIYMKRERCL